MSNTKNKTPRTETEDKKPQIRKEDTYIPSANCWGSYMIRRAQPRRYAYEEKKPFYLDGTTVYITNTGKPITYQGKWKVKELKEEDLTKGQKKSTLYPTFPEAEKPTETPKKWYFSPCGAGAPTLVANTESWKYNLQPPIFEWDKKEEAEEFIKPIFEGFKNEKFKYGYLGYIDFNVEPDNKASEEEIQGFKLALKHMG